MDNWIHVRLFYKLIQLLHHLTYFTENGSPPKAFARKLKHLDSFVKPAYSGPEILSTLKKINQNWFNKTNEALRDYYHKSIDLIKNQIKSLKLDPSDLLELQEQAIKRATKNFGKKLNLNTIRSFKAIICPLLNSSPTQTQSKHTHPQPQRNTHTEGNTSHPKNTHPHPQRNTQAQRTPTPHVRNVKGPQDPLSNFFSCKLWFRGQCYRSAEHAYQTHKSLFNGQKHESARQIHFAPTAAKAKFLGGKIKANSQWFQFRTKLMFDILVEKFLQVSIFRNHLLNSKNQTILHPVPDLFWGTGTTKGKGKNIFSKILVDVLNFHTQRRPNKPTPPKPHTSIQQRTNLVQTSNRFSALSDLNNQPSSKPVEHLNKAAKSQPSIKPKQKTVLPLISSSQPTRSTPSSPPKSPSRSGTASPISCSAPTNPWAEISIGGHSPAENHFPALPEAPKALASPLPQREKRRRNSAPMESTPARKRADRRESSSPIKVRRHVGGALKDQWSWPESRCKNLVIGDSNLARITKRESNVQIESFSGANFQNFTDMLKKLNNDLPNLKKPKNIIVSLGINNRDAHVDKTSIRNLKTLTGHLLKKFPTSKIFFVELNFAETLRSETKSKLNQINKAISELCMIKTIPKLNTSKFKTATDHIHWTEQTANFMLEHWLTFLN